MLTPIYTALGDIAGWTDSPDPPAPAQPTLPGAGVGVFNKIVLGGWQLEGKSDGIYVTTPDGIVTKMELIDFRQTPVPSTSPLALQPSQETVAPIAVGQGNSGAISTGNWQAGVTPTTTTAAETPANPVGDQSMNNSPVPVPDGELGPGGNPGVGPGYAPTSDAGKQTLTNHGITDPQFVAGLDNLSQQLNVPSDNMIIVFQIESGLQPHIQNSIGATGLNQIMPDTAKGLGYTVDQIKLMSATEQITGPTAKYFLACKRYLPAAPSMADIYLVNLYPLACGKPDDWVLGSPKADGTVTKEIAATKIASQNKPFAMGGSVITVGSFKQWLSNKWKM